MQAGPHVMLAVSDTGRRHGSGDAVAHLRAVLHDQGGRQGHRARALDGLRDRRSRAAAPSGSSSELGRGTTFKVYVPRVEGATPSSLESRRSCDLQGTETILLVEDENRVRAVARSILQQAWLSRPRSAATRARRFSSASSRPAPIHLLLTDVVMPQMSGPELAEATRTDPARA